MTSIRRRTASLVATAMTVLLVIGGAALLIVLRRAMTAQFDQALIARAAALQSITRFDGTKVELDFAGEAMPRYARRADAEFFILWVQTAGGWRLSEHSASLGDVPWPPQAVRDGPPGITDLTLQAGGTGRAALVEYTPPREPDEETDHQAQPTPAPAAAPGTAQPPPPPTVRLLVVLPRAPLDRSLTLIGWSIAGVGGVLVLASIAASCWAVSRGLVPLSDLSARVRSIGPQTLATRFDPAALPAELRPIAEQLSALLARLDDAFEREKRFSAAASHELRTPIAELRMLLEVASNQPRTTVEWQRTAETAMGVLTRAQSLSETLLRLSRAGSHQTAPRDHYRANIAQALTEQTARAIAMHGGGTGQIRTECSDSLAANADQATLGSIIGNLLDNALTHGQATAADPVTVGVDSRAGSVHIRITNTAPALTDEDLAHLFEPFWRKDASRQDQRGFGLGLAVARTLARACNGEITAQRESNSTVTLQITLPIAQ